MKLTAFALLTILVPSLGQGGGGGGPGGGGGNGGGGNGGGGNGGGGNGGNGGGGNGGGGNGGGGGGGPNIPDDAECLRQCKKYSYRIEQKLNIPTFNCIYSFDN